VGNTTAPDASDNRSGGRTARIIIVGTICGILLLIVLAVYWR
jgi:hypothetical protein